MGSFWGSKAVLRGVRAAGVLFWVFAAGCVLGADVPDRASPLSVTLTVANPSDQDQVACPVTVGVPIPKGATDGLARVTSTSQLVLVDANNRPVPAQFRVLSRWGGDRQDPGLSIKWVLVDFQANVRARGTARYRLVAHRGADRPSGALSLSEDESGVTVSTGRLSFRISKKSFNLFDWVRYGEDDLVDSSPGNGVNYKSFDGKEYPSATSSPEGSIYQVAVEESGPMKAVIRVSGAYKLTRKEFSRRAYLGYCARFYAYSGKEWVRVVYTLENNGRGVQNQAGDEYDVAYIRSLIAKLTLRLGPVKWVTFDGFSERFSTGRYKLEQVHVVRNPSSEDENFEYTLWRESGGGYQPVGFKGKRYSGWMDLSDESRGVTLAVRWFWQNSPKALYVDGSSVGVGIFPEGLGDVSGVDGQGAKPKAGSMYRFRGGYYKTTEMLFWFHGPDVSMRSAVVAAFQRPLVAKADPDWYTVCEAFGWPIAGKGKWVPQNTGMDERLKTALSRYESWMRARWDPSAASQSKPEELRSLYGVRESRQQGNLDLYGWEHFGCVGWQFGHSAQHYDWTWGLVLQFLRTGDAEFWDLVQETALHSVDIDLIHLRGPDRQPMFFFGGNYFFWINRYERDAHDVDYQGDLVPRRSHSWVRGKVAYYLLTGDERFFEDAWAMAEATRLAVSQDPGQFDRQETRFIGWSVEALVSVYGVTYERPMLDAALELFRILLRYESRVNDVPQGYTNVRGYYGLKYDELITNESYYAEPLLLLFRYTGDPEVKAYLLREAYWVKDGYILGGTFDKRGWYHPLSGVVDNWSETDPAGGNRYTQNLWLLVDLIAFAWEQTRLPQFRDLARRMFADSIIHWMYWRQPGNLAPVPPDSVDPVYMGEWYQVSKEQGKVQRSFQLYLWLEANPPPTDGKEPGIEISADTLELDAGGSVTLFGKSDSGARVVWYFGDGTPPVEGKGELTVAHSYAEPGTYVATFEAVGEGGALARRSVKLVVGALPELVLSVKALPEAVKPGEDVVVDVHVRNSGGGTARDVVITVPLPDGTEFAAGSAEINGKTQEAEAAGGLVKIAVGDIPPGASASIRFRVFVR